MAGNFPDAPSRRMAHDVDGTVAFGWEPYDNPIYLYALSAQEHTNINNEDGDTDNRWYITALDADAHLALLFPEKRELDGVFIKSYPSTSAVQSSGDTTSGFDGTWTTQIADIDDPSGMTPDYRDSITSLAVATASCIRLRLVNASFGDKALYAFHVYGTISPGETPDRILFLDTANSDAVFTKPIDYGEVPRGQTQQRTIKLKNNSASKTINTIQITAEDLYLNAGGWYTFSPDDVSYQATYAVGNLGPGATKLIYVKQEVPDAETLGLQTGRLRVSHASLT